MALQVLKDLDLTFFKAQLVPAAHVHVHINEGKGQDLWAPHTSPPAMCRPHNVGFDGLTAGSLTGFACLHLVSHALQGLHMASPC